MRFFVEAAPSGARGGRLVGSGRTTWRWATEPPRMGMASLRALERWGWVRVAEDPRWPGSWLLRRAGAARAGPLGFREPKR
jgi:hypothetical protein